MYSKVKNWNSCQILWYKRKGEKNQNQNQNPVDNAKKEGKITRKKKKKGKGGRINNNEMCLFIYITLRSMHRHPFRATLSIVPSIALHRSFDRPTEIQNEF